MENKNNFKLKLIPISLFILFIIIGTLVYTVPQVTAWDIKIIEFLQKTFSFVSVNCLAEISSIRHNYCSLLILLITLYLVEKKDYRLAIIYLVCNITCNDITAFVKNIFQRHRPPIELQPFYHPNDYSFPSGHSFGIMLLFGIIIYIIFKYVKNNILKYGLSLICTMIIISVGLSRNLLGVHYPTDVIAGFTLGALIISFIYLIDRKTW